MKRFLIALLFLPFFVFAQGPDHWATRIAIAGNQVGSIGQGQVLMLGDSITEMFWWNILGGHFVLNVGLGGAGIDEVTIAAKQILPVAKPRVVVLMVGINDCVKDYAAEPSAWGVKYRALLDLIKQNGGIPIALSILPVESDQAKGLGANYFDSDCYRALNQQWYAAVTSRGERYVNLNYVFAVPPDYRYMQPNWTFDGVHPYGIGMSSLFYQIDPAVSAAFR